MTQYSAGQVVCPHCGGRNAGSPLFCGKCGKAVPAAVRTGPRVVSGLGEEDMPTSTAGREMLGGHLNKEMKKAGWALLAVAVVQTVMGPIILIAKVSAMEGGHPGMVYRVKPVAWLIIFGIAAAFWGLYAWSRRSPMPAAIVGLVLYVTLLVVDAIYDPSTIVQGWLVKGFVIVALSQALVAGVKARRMEQQRGMGY